MGVAAPLGAATVWGGFKGLGAGWHASRTGLFGLTGITAPWRRWATIHVSKGDSRPPVYTYEQYLRFGRYCRKCRHE